MSQKLGKVKRLRQERAAKCGRTMTMRDPSTGLDVEMRHSGMTFSEFHQHILSICGPEGRPRNDKDATVPCNGCTTSFTTTALRCCRGWRYRNIWRT
jgi:hypothetical protein